MSQKMKRMEKEEALKYYREKHPEVEFYYDDFINHVVSKDGKVYSMIYGRDVLKAPLSKFRTSNGIGYRKSDLFNPEDIPLEEGEVLIRVPDTRDVCTNYGRIFDKCGNRIFTHVLNNGYLAGGIKIGEIQISTTAQRVIAYAFGLLTKEQFLNYESNQLDVDHIDDDKTNNRLDNLQILHHYQNVVKRDRNGAPMEGKIGSDHVRSIPILQCDLNGKLIKEWGSTHLAAVELGFDYSAIHNATTGKYSKKNPHKYKNYLWYRKENKNE